MDIRCPRCGEPWDIETLHEAVSESNPKANSLPQKEYEVYFNKVKREFFRKGCVVVGGGNCEVNTRYALVSAIANELGDDIDGISDSLEDAERFGLFNE